MAYNNFNPYYNPNLYSGKVETNTPVTTPHIRTNAKPSTNYTGMMMNNPYNTNNSTSFQYAKQTPNMDDPYGLMSGDYYGNVSHSSPSNFDMGNYSGTISAVGNVASTAIDSSRSAENVNVHGAGPSDAQQIVGMIGPWGQAVSSVSQVGTSIGDSVSGNYDEDGLPTDINSHTTGQFISHILDPSRSFELNARDDVETWEKLGILGLGGIGGAIVDNRLQRDAIKERDAKRLAEREMKNKKMYADELEAQRKDVQAKRLSSVYNIPTSYY